MIDKMREDSSRAIIPGEKKALHAHLAKRKKQGVRMNLNHLGEAVLGEQEALCRLQTYLADLEDPEIEYLSVKISTIYSQIQSLAFEHSVKVLIERLAQLYGASRDNTFVRNDGSKAQKYVNLDMEEYRDAEITMAAFTRTLDRQEFKNTAAGIVLQAYLPDSYKLQGELTAWARKRVAAGSAPISLRIVKGANMEMEKVESALHNWPLAPYDNKLEVDANFKRMIDFGMQPENIKAVRLGIASHNLFELAYAYKLAQHLKVSAFFAFEMLEGMADHVRRALQETTGDLLLYAPIAGKKDFINAIAYLIRRLDENTAEENFLRYAPNLRTDSDDWRYLRHQFVASCGFKEKAGRTPHRIQNRLEETFPQETGTYYDGEFVNEPDTDWALAANRKWADRIRDKWKKKESDAPAEILLGIGDEEVFSDREQRKCFDPSQLPEKVCVARYTLATKDDVDRAVAMGREDPDGWRKKTAKERHRVLSRVAMAIRSARGDLIGVAAGNTGKVFTEADVEVSEAVDFSEFYPHSVKAFDRLENVEVRGKGVGLVISPWNFPIAIPCGGIVASLSTGNTVLFKPSSAAVMAGWRLCQCFWGAGIPRSALQFLPCDGGSVGKYMTTRPDIDFIILTGGTETGLSILGQTPGVYLAAETGGKNATIVTAMADRDQAIRNVVYSAFGNTGQKCSATSLLVLEKEIYDSEEFKTHLVDAARSLATGSSWDFSNKMGPLITAPSGDLEKGLTQLEPGENWALKPQNLNTNPRLWTPGIKYGVQYGSYTHQTEFFGPVLGVMRAESLEHAIEMVNATGYGLTSGLESLDQREQEVWQATIIAGNLYMNRGTTGAIVLRQPFGGMRKSALGAGIKAGGPNYVAQLMEFEETGLPQVGPIENDHALLRLAHRWKQKLDWGQLYVYQSDLKKTVRAIKSYLYYFDQEFGRSKDYFHLRGQDNLVHYVPVGTVLIRVHPQDSLYEVLARIAAAQIAGCKVIVSLAPEVQGQIAAFLDSKEGKDFRGDCVVSHQSDADLVDVLPGIDRIRYAAPERVPVAVFAAAAKIGFYICREPVLMEGRVELIHYFQEQSICNNYHRYGNLGERAVVG
jgi:RHH-type proline utilization regulon transcriptional repressor/proline dehydrogenase/delta 1-pyrroline-5-carboxylate dehydrogenase